MGSYRQKCGSSVDVGMKYSRSRAPQNAGTAGILRGKNVGKYREKQVRIPY